MPRSNGFTSSENVISSQHNVCGFTCRVGIHNLFNVHTDSARTYAHGAFSSTQLFDDDLTCTYIHQGWHI